MFGPPKDVEGQCNATLHIADDYGDNHTTMRCQLPPSHEGVHKEVFQRHGDVTVTWHADARKQPYFKAKTLVAFTTDTEKLERPIGTVVEVVEELPSGAPEPEAYIVEVAIEDKSLEGNHRFDTAELKASDLERMR